MAVLISPGGATVTVPDEKAAQLVLMGFQQPTATTVAVGEPQTKPRAKPGPKPKAG